MNTRLLALALAVPLIARRGAPGPFFISAQYATDANGAARWSAFDPAIGAVLKKDAERNRPGPCPVSIISACHLSAPARSFRDLIVNARAVYEGTVADLTPGFEVVRPVTLVGIDIQRVIRSTDGFPTSGRILVIHPTSDFTIGGARFCNAASSTSAPLPGDRVLLFAYEPPEAARTSRSEEHTSELQ